MFKRLAIQCLKTAACRRWRRFLSSYSAILFFAIFIFGVTPASADCPAGTKSDGMGNCTWTWKSGTDCAPGTQPDGKGNCTWTFKSGVDCPPGSTPDAKGNCTYTFKSGTDCAPGSESDGKGNCVYKFKAGSECSAGTVPDGKGGCSYKTVVAKVCPPEGCPAQFTCPGNQVLDSIKGCVCAFTLKAPVNGACEQQSTWVEVCADGSLALKGACGCPADQTKSQTSGECICGSTMKPPAAGGTCPSPSVIAEACFDGTFALQGECPCPSGQYKSGTSGACVCSLDNQPPGSDGCPVMGKKVTPVMLMFRCGFDEKPNPFSGLCCPAGSMPIFDGKCHDYLKGFITDDKFSHCPNGSLKPADGICLASTVPCDAAGPAALTTNPFSLPFRSGPACCPAGYTPQPGGECATATLAPCPENTMRAPDHSCVCYDGTKPAEGGLCPTLTASACAPGFVKLGGGKCCPPASVTSAGQCCPFGNVANGRQCVLATANLNTQDAPLAKKKKGKGETAQTQGQGTKTIKSQTQKIQSPKLDLPGQTTGSQPPSSMGGGITTGGRR